MTVGIDKIGFATSQYALKLADLARERGVDPDKYSKGLLLDTLSISPITEDIVTLGASAAHMILSEQDLADIDMVLFATESGIDQSKAAGIFVHGLLNIQPFARTIEIKEACYGATAALHYAQLHVTARPTSKVLVIASDIAKYGIESSGEPTQGAGSIAMLITHNPRILAFNDDNVAQTRDVMDFWRPNYSTTPFVDGIYSTRQYLESLKTTWEEYQSRYNLTMGDFAAFTFHLPYPKLALKGLKKLLDKTVAPLDKERLTEAFMDSILYSQQVGNIYTGSLFLGLLSLLENNDKLKGGDRIGLFSYGSGAVAEIFSGTLVQGYKDMLNTDRKKQLEQRQLLSVSEYEQLFFEESKLDNTGSQIFKEYNKQMFALTAIHEHKRHYEKVEK
ncbi:Hydroxymethylglutaryl-CoA synthase [Streptococcus sp. DD10]|uniref:hydroxymethylglutaryl-CoA synthase n=1 Tax=Streptococcus sp. DD10 TaxID=1777878 RepID=UPI000797D13E|nr:hydroxymethylglutaryl-CoA synthase [Streptococcus sp. DD10]KXT74786.1 Hydroxymethylglutaryl-CoA synthase [Streptococcus sp. DD10]